MQQLARDEAGNTWELDAQGNPIRLVAPASGGRVFSLAPNPKDVRQEQRQDARDATTAADRAADNARADRQLQLAEEAAARAAEEARFKEGGTAKMRAEWKANLGSISQLERMIGKLRQQYKDHFEGKGPIKSLAESYAPVGLNPEYGVFDDDAQSLLADMAKAKGLTAQQFNTPAEQRMFFEPLIPKRGDTDEQIVNKLNNLEAMIASGKRTTLMNLGIDAEAGQADQRADNEVPDPSTGADLKPPAAPPEQGGNIALPSDGQRIIRDPRVAAQLDAMINAGAGEGTINAMLRKNNFPMVRSSDLVAARQWMKQNPGKKYYGSDPTRTEDLNIGQRILANETVAPIAAGLGHYANNATAGLVGAMAGEEGQGALDAAATLNPTAATIGGLAGGVTGALGAEAAVAARAPAALARFAPRIADALYGGALGFNTAREGEGLKGALTGAGAGLAGGFIGQRLASGAGRALRGVSNPDVQALRQAGVPLTVGRAVGHTGPIGKMIRGTEDRLTGFPVVGDAVNARNTESVEAFAERMANDAVAPIGGSTTGYGKSMIDDILDQGGAAYDNVTAGVNVPLDPQFATDAATLRAWGGLLPDDLAGKLDQAITNRVKPIEDAGELTGETFQQAARGLKGYRAEMARPGFEQDYRDALGFGIDALKGQMGRGGGQSVVDGLANADQAWKQIKIVQKATEAARNGARSGEVGLPMPSHFNDAALAASKKYGGPRFNGDLIDAGQRLLPSKVGDSGTAGRLGVGMLLGAGVGLPGAGGAAEGGALGAAGGAGIGGLGTMLLLAAGGSKPAQKLVVNALTERPDLLKHIGDEVFDKKWMGGIGGVGATTPFISGY